MVTSLLVPFPVKDTFSPPLVLPGFQQPTQLSAKPKKLTQPAPRSVPVPPTEPFADWLLSCFSPVTGYRSRADSDHLSLSKGCLQSRLKRQTR